MNERLFGPSVSPHSADVCAQIPSHISVASAWDEGEADSSANKAREKQHAADGQGIAVKSILNGKA
jgi:hypothetical protein